MSTVDIAKRSGSTRIGAPWGIEGRGLAIVTCLCAAVFACFFAIGRAVSPGGSPREAPLQSLSVVAGGAAIPIRLSSAPSLDIGVAARVSRSAQAGNVPVSGKNIAATAPGFTGITPPKQAPQTEPSPSISPAAPQPAAPAAPTSSQEHSSTGAGSPAGNRKSSRSAPSTSKSFDSSG
jgi:hypothetical protein